QPSSTQNLATGGSYSVVDRDGRAGDVYALVEVDSRTAVRVFGPVSAVQSAARSPVTSRRLGPVDEDLTRRDLAMAERLRSRSLALQPYLASGRLEPPTIPTVDVDVTREGLYAVCDSDTLRWGGLPVSVTLRGVPVSAFALTSPCAGLGFYAPAPSSAY